MDSHREMRVDMSLPWMGERMTYKLESGLSRITSPIALIFPNHTSQRYENGEKACEAVFDKRWKVMEMRVAGDAIEVVVEEMQVPKVNQIGEETFL